MEKLIEELHNPGNHSAPGRIHEIQRQIQVLQREKAAWQLGLDLLQHGDATVRFYGALTLTIKINADWDNDGLNHDEQLRKHLLEALVTNYVRLTSLSDASFVLKKLGSTLITFFAKTDSGWKLPMRHVLACMIAAQYVPEESLPEVDQLLASSNSVHNGQSTGVITLATIMAEDLSNHTSSALEESSINGRVGANCLDTLQLLRYCTMMASDGMQTRDKTYQLLQMVMAAIPYWVNTIRYADAEVTSELERFATMCISSSTHYLGVDELTGSALQMLVSLELSSARLLRNALPGYPSVLVTSNKMQQLINSLLQGDFTADAVLYVDLLETIIGRVDTTKPDYLHDQWYVEIVRVLARLLRCEGVAVIEDPICQIVLQRITEMVEGSTDWDATDGEELDVMAKDVLKSVTVDACEACLQKIKIPPEQMSRDTQDWDVDDRARFRDFRHDVHDFYQSAFTILGDSLIAELVKTVLEQGETPEWSVFEAGLFSLMAFLDDTSSENGADDEVRMVVFNSSAWALLQSSRDVPDRALHTGINFVAENVAHLHRLPEKLVPILNFLFSSLHLKVSSSAASRAIYKLCEAHRGMLQEGLPQFMNSLGSIEHLADAERHRIYAAVAAIVQALPGDELKVQPLLQLLMPVSRILEGTLGGSADDEELLRMCIDIVQTLASIGKGLRSPAEAPIDLEAYTSDESNYWTDGSGSLVQREVLNLYHVTLARIQSNVNNIFLDGCCDFIKSGFTETHPSPFKFPDAIGLQLMTEIINADTPSIDNVLTCAISYLASVEERNLNISLSGLVYVLVPIQQQILLNFRQTRQLPNSSFPSASLDFLSRLFTKFGKMWFAMTDGFETAAVAMELGLIVMQDTDTLPRRSAAAFFAAFADFSGPDTALQAEAQLRTRQLLESFGPRILSLLLILIGGECARSELESLAETLRRFAQKQTMLTKAVFREAVKEESAVMSAKSLKATTLEQRNRFVAQVEALRGARKTNEIVKNFWIACRGSGFGYVA